MDKLEIWFDIFEYEGLYQVSDKGRVRSLYDGRWNKERIKVLKGILNEDGYLHVILHKDGQQKYKYVHRLVAQAFLPDYSEDLDVNHLDECKSNNNVCNLAMCTSGENNNYGTRNARVAEKLSKKVLCLTNGVIYPSIMEASRQLNLSPGNISYCRNGKRKQTGGYQFQFV